MSIKQNKSSRHKFFMNLALMQAKINLGNTKENPSVGCVIVKNNCVISAGFTGIKGRPHAEQQALRCSKNNIKNSDLYVTLEPCSNFGKTPPCVKAIIKSKINRVFFSLKDPDLKSYNKSSDQFKRKKIKVHIGILFFAVRNFYKSYVMNKTQTLPFVASKMAISKDFYTKKKNGKWITNEKSRARAHLIRMKHDSILTSSKTIIDDNPLLTCRIPGTENYSPARIILDKKLQIPITSKIVKTAYKHRTIIFYNKINKKKIKALKNLKIKLSQFPLEKDGNFDLKEILRKAKLFGFSRILLESGLNLTTNFLKKDLIDDFHLFISDRKLKMNGNNNFKRIMKLFFRNKKFINEKVNLFGDRLIFYRLK